MDLDLTPVTVPPQKHTTLPTIGSPSPLPVPGSDKKRKHTAEGSEMADSGMSSNASPGHNVTSQLSAIEEDQTRLSTSHGNVKPAGLATPTKKGVHDAEKRENKRRKRDEPGSSPPAHIRPPETQEKGKGKSKRKNGTSFSNNKGESVRQKDEKYNKLKQTLAEKEKENDDLKKEMERLAEGKRGMEMVLDSFEEELRCGICQESFIDPVTVEPCGHSYCGACMANFLRSYQINPKLVWSHPNHSSNLMEGFYKEEQKQGRRTIQTAVHRQNIPSFIKYNDYGEIESDSSSDEEEDNPPPPQAVAAATGVHTYTSDSDSDSEQSQDEDESADSVDSDSGGNGSDDSAASASHGNPQGESTMEAMNGTEQGNATAQPVASTGPALSVNQSIEEVVEHNIIADHQPVEEARPENLPLGAEVDNTTASEELPAETAVGAAAGPLGPIVHAEEAIPASAETAEAAQAGAPNETPTSPMIAAASVVLPQVARTGTVPSTSAIPPAGLQVPSAPTIPGPEVLPVVKLGDRKLSKMGISCVFCKRTPITGIVPALALGAATEVLAKARPEFARERDAMDDHRTVYSKGQPLSFPIPIGKLPSYTAAKNSMTIAEARRIRAPARYWKPCHNCIAVPNTARFVCPIPVPDPNNRALRISKDLPCPGHIVCGLCERLTAESLAVRCDGCGESACKPCGHGHIVKLKHFAGAPQDLDPINCPETYDNWISRLMVGLFRNNASETALFVTYAHKVKRLSQIPIGTADTTGALQDTTKFNALKPNRIVRDMVTWLESPIGIASGAYNGIFERAKVAHRIQLNTGGEGRLCRPCGTNVYKYGLYEWWMRHVSQAEVQSVFPDSVKNRTQCKFGINCDYQGNIDHARHYSHLCAPLPPDELSTSDQITPVDAGVVSGADYVVELNAARVLFGLVPQPVTASTTASDVTEPLVTENTDGAIPVVDHVANPEHETDPPAGTTGEGDQQDHGQDEEAAQQYNHDFDGGNFSDEDAELQAAIAASYASAVSSNAEASVEDVEEEIEADMPPHHEDLGPGVPDSIAPTPEPEAPSVTAPGQ